MRHEILIQIKSEPTQISSHDLQGVAEDYIKAAAIDCKKAELPHSNLSLAFRTAGEFISREFQCASSVDSVARKLKVFIERKQ